jgi:hypothetical protein
VVKIEITAIMLQLRHQRDEFLLRDAMFFALGTKDTIEGIRGAVAGFVVVADLHLADVWPDEVAQRLLRGLHFAE